MDKISEIVQGYLGMTPQDKGCKNWSEMQTQMVNELDEVVKNINYDTVLPTAVCCNCFCEQPVHKEGSVYCKEHANM